MALSLKSTSFFLGERPEPGHGRPVARRGAVAERPVHGCPERTGQYALGAPEVSHAGAERKGFRRPVALRQGLQSLVIPRRGGHGDEEPRRIAGDAAQQRYLPGAHEPANRRRSELVGSNDATSVTLAFGPPLRPYRFNQIESMPAFSAP